VTKGERLIWELFEMVREVMPATAQNAERFNLWAAKFHEMEHPETPPVPAAEPLPEPEPEVDEPDEPEPDEPAADPHEHGVPSRPPKRKKR
jgi:outer membrane biosynthesis protein TonB